MPTKQLSSADVRAALEAGALLVDIREPDEHARERIPGAINMPLGCLGPLPLGDGPVVFHCRSGMRTTANATQLCAAAGTRPVFVLNGGIEAWRRDGQATILDRKQPLEIMRQVQIAAGSLVLLGVVLGFLVAPGFFGLSAFVGTGLVFAGATGWCGMASLLRVMPWNSRAAA